MSTVPRQGTHVMGVRFHPTDAELINYLKKFFKGQRFSSNDCPIEVADIYGDQPPWEIFGASQEKIRYFITPLKKRKSEYIRKNNKGPVLGFRRNFTFLTKEEEQNKTWLMKEYYVADDFFKENNIPKEDFVVCRIKKKKALKDDSYVAMEEKDVARIINAMLHGPDCTIQDDDQVIIEETDDQWNSIIDRICDEQAAGDQVEDTTTLMQEEYHDLIGCNNGLQNELDSSYVATSVEKQDTTWSSATLEQEGAYGQILEQEQGQGADDIIIGSGEFREEMNEISEGIATDVPHDWWQQTSLLRDL
ncbi:hypothetical protein HAX54_019504 [Datura stramonium]|uniref:NAC domain-containing protein n=1 Tax=Datura stramonium TaxID=4076 RepID=A0ABS8S207_DATST|nr:hypothetical protein [Datura stramonium]